MTRAILARLDARDRDLFVRWSLFDRASKPARVFWTVLTHLGGVSCSIAAAVMPMSGHGALAAAARHAFATLVISHVIVQLIKRTVGRPRPSRSIATSTLVNEPDKFSFPSGHSAAAMSVAFVYALAFPAYAAVIIPIAVLVGMSRVVLGVHYPGDVLMGQLLAVFTGLGITLF